jgi:hypothetical protein
MKALQIRQYGGKDVLELNQNVAKPVAGEGQVLVETREKLCLQMVSDSRARSGRQISG